MDEIDASREESLAMWAEGSPVALAKTMEGRFALSRIVHSSLCALNATGHRGPCTCKAAEEEK